MTEASLSVLKVVVGALPTRTRWLVARGGSNWLAGIGDGVIEAIGLDARGGLLPGAASARLVRPSAQRFREVGSWPPECDAQVLAAAARKLRFELGCALAQDAAFGLPFRAVGDRVCEAALAGRCRLVLGELEAVALESEPGGVRGAPAQHTAGGLVQLGDACARGVGDALRVGPGAAGGVKLVGEVFGVAADALAKLREFGLKLNDRRAADGGAGVCGLEVG